MGYVAGGCNVQCTCCTEHGRYGLSCLYAETVESIAVLAGSVWYVYMGKFNAATYSKHVHVPKQLSEHSKSKTSIMQIMNVYTLNETV